jgi:hypothetical protein
MSANIESSLQSTTSHAFASTAGLQMEDFNALTSSTTEGFFAVCVRGTSTVNNIDEIIRNCSLCALTCDDIPQKDPLRRRSTIAGVALAALSGKVSELLPWTKETAKYLSLECVGRRTAKNYQTHAGSTFRRCGIDHENFSENKRNPMSRWLEVGSGQQFLSNSRYNLVAIDQAALLREADRADDFRGVAKLFGDREWARVTQWRARVVCLFRRVSSFLSQICFRY